MTKNKNGLYLDFKHSYNDFDNLIGGAVYGLINLDEFFNKSGYIKLRFFDTKTLKNYNAEFENIGDGIKNTDAFMNALKSRSYKELVYSNTVKRLINLLSNQTLPVHQMVRNKFNRSIARTENKKLVGYVIP